MDEVWFAAGGGRETGVAILPETGELRMQRLRVRVTDHRGAEPRVLAEAPVSAMALEELRDLLDRHVDRAQALRAAAIEEVFARVEPASRVW